MLNYNTIISSFDDKVTLMKWLKIVDENLKNGSALTFKVNKKGNATISFSIVFADGSEIESGYIEIQKGDSVESASIVNGHLLLTLTNGTQIDAGNVKPITSVAFDASRHLIVTFGDGTTQDAGLVKGVSGFSINENQHLIVNYDNGTSEDLGAIFDGDVNIDGNFTANSIIEKMEGYGFEAPTPSLATCHIDYAGVVKNGNKITYAISGVINFSSFPSSNNIVLGTFTHPVEIGLKLFPSTISGVSNILSNKKISFSSSFTSFNDVPLICFKNGYTKIYFQLFNVSSVLELNTDYHFRIEETFLLSDNLAS